MTTSANASTQRANAAEAALDLLSASFDAEAALGAGAIDDVRIPVPAVEARRKLQQCAELVPPCVRRETQELCGFGGVKTEEEKRLAEEKKRFLCDKAHEYNAKVAALARRDPLLEIARRVRSGPLMLLRRAFQDRCPIDVVTRHGRGVRGTMRAELHGFDKFMNLLLAEVEELYAARERVTRIVACTARDTPSAACATASNPGGPEAAAARVKERSGWKQVLRARKLSRVLLKGDQIVSVSFAAPGPLRLPGVLAHLQCSLQALYNAPARH